LEGNILGAEDGMVILYRMDGSKEIPVDTTKMTNGYFIFTNLPDSPGLYRLIPGSHKYPIRYFFLDKGKTIFSSSVNIKGMMKVPKIEGNPLQKAFNAYQFETDSIQDSIRQINFRMHDAKQAGISIQPKLYDDRLSELEHIQENSIIKHIALNKGNLVSAWLIWFNYMSNNDIEAIQRLYNTLQIDVRKSSPAQLVESRINKLLTLQPGKKAPDFSLPDNFGKTVKLSDYSGSCVLIDFWASWCKPCREQLPEIKEIQSQFNANGLKIIGISLDDDKGRWLEALKKEQMNWCQVSELKKWDQKVVRDYNISAIPLTVLIDETGNILMYGKSPQEIKSLLQDYYKKK